MKINDKQLLEKIWLNQLRRLSTGVLHNYVGGVTGLCHDDDFWYQSASSEHRCSRSNVTDVIKPKQLLTRLRAFAELGEIKFPNELTFFIDNDRARAAFISARNFWLDNGVPEGTKNGRANTAKVDKKFLAEACLNRLEEQYAQHHA